MPTKEHEITLKGFQFPPTLPNNKANFRFVFDLRYINEKGEYKTESAVMPSFDTYLECDTRKRKSPNYVRADNASAFDMGKIDHWDKLIFLGKANRLHSIQVKVFDVDRKDFWDTLQGAFSQIVQAVFGRITSNISIPQVFSDAFGTVTDDLKSTLTKRMAGGDKVLFRGSSALDGQSPFDIDGAGSLGDYKVTIEVEERSLTQ